MKLPAEFPAKTAGQKGMAWYIYVFKKMKQKNLQPRM